MELNDTVVKDLLAILWSRGLEAGKTAEVEQAIASRLRAILGSSLSTFKAIEQQFLSSSSTSGGKVCGKVFVSGDLSFTCKTCASDTTCCMCQSCWDACRHLHEEHDVTFHFAGAGGTCDCGDEEAWDVGGMCPHHSPVSASSHMDPSASLDPRVRECLSALFQAVGAFASVVAMDVGHSYATLPQLRTQGPDGLLDARYGGRYSVKGRLPSAPADAGGTQGAGQGATGSSTAATTQQTASASAGPPAAAPASAQPAGAPEHTLSDSDDEIPQLVSVRDPAVPPSRPVPHALLRLASRAGTSPVAAQGVSVQGLAALSYKVMIHNDDIHTYADVETAFMLAAGMARAQAGELTRNVDKIGEGVFPAQYTIDSKDLAMQRPDGKALLKAHAQLSKAGLQFSVQPLQLLAAQSTVLSLLKVCSRWCTQSAGVARLMGDAWAAPAPMHLLQETVPELRDISRVLASTDVRHSKPGWVAEGGQVPLNVDPEGDKKPLRVVEASKAALRPAYTCSEVCDDPVSCLPAPPLAVGPEASHVLHAFPLLSLVRWDMHLPYTWRKASHELYTQLLRIPHFRHAFGTSFLRVLPILSRQYALGIGTGDQSILDLSVQVLTVPSVVAAGVQEAQIAQYAAGTLWNSLSVALRAVKLPKHLGDHQPEVFNGARYPSLPSDMYSANNSGAGLQEGAALVTPAALDLKHHFLQRRDVGLRYTDVLRDLTYLAKHPPFVQALLLAGTQNGPHASTGRPQTMQSRPLHSLLAAFMSASYLSVHYRKLGSHVDYIEQGGWVAATDLSNCLAGLSTTLADHMAVTPLGEHAGSAVPPLVGLKHAASVVGDLIRTLAETRSQANLTLASRMKTAYARESDEMDKTRRQTAKDDIRELAGYPLVRVGACVGSYGLVRKEWQQPVSFGPATLFQNGHRFVADLAEGLTRASLVRVQLTDGMTGPVGVTSQLYSINPADYIFNSWLKTLSAAQGVLKATSHILCPPVRSLVFGSQVRAGLWKRNGAEDAADEVNTSRDTYVMLEYGRDIKAVQLGVLCMRHPQLAFAALVAEWGLLPFLEMPAVPSTSSQATSAMRQAHGELDRKYAEHVQLPLLKGSVHDAQDSATHPSWIFPAFVMHTQGHAEAFSVDSMSSNTLLAVRSILTHGSHFSPNAVALAKRAACAYTLTQARDMMCEFLRFLSVLVTNLPVATGGPVAPPDAAYTHVEGPLAAAMRAKGSLYGNVMELPGESELLSAVDALLGFEKGSGKRKREGEEEQTDARAALEASTSSSAGADAAEESTTTIPAAVATMPGSFAMAVDEEGPDRNSSSAAGEAPEQAAQDSGTEQETAQLLGIPAGSLYTVTEASEDIVESSKHVLLRRELVHALASGKEGAGKPRSALAKYASVVLGEKKSARVEDGLLSSVLSDIADCKEASSAEGTTLYVLKEAVLVSEYDQTYPHLPPAAHSVAGQWWDTKRKAAAQGKAATGGGSMHSLTLAKARPIAPVPPPCMPGYLPVRRLLHTVATAHMLRVLLSDAALAAVHAPLVMQASEGRSTVSSGTVALPRGMEWMNTVQGMYSTELAKARTSTAVLKAALHVLTLALHTWPASASHSSGSEGDTVAQAFAEALACPTLVLPYGGLHTPLASVPEGQAAFDLQAYFGAPCPPVAASLYAIMRTESIDESCREGAAWCLSRLCTVSSITEGSVRLQMGEELDAAAAEERAVAEAARKTEMEGKRKAAQERAMASMKAKQAALLSKFAADDDSDEEHGARAGPSATPEAQGSSASGQGDAPMSAGSRGDDDEGGSIGEEEGADAGGALPRIERPVTITTDPSKLLGISSLVAHVDNTVDAAQGPPAMPGPGLGGASPLAAVLALETPPPPPTCILCQGGIEHGAAPAGGSAEAAAAEGGVEKGPIAYLAYVHPSALAYHASEQGKQYAQELTRTAGQSATERNDALLPKPLRQYIAYRPKLDRHDGSVHHVVDQAIHPETQQVVGLVDVPVKEPYLLAAVLPVGVSHGLHYSFCGHCAHMGCLHEYAVQQAKDLLSVATAAGQELARYLQPFAEFSCPLCRGLCNSAVQHQGSVWPLAALSRAALPSEATAKAAVARVETSSRKLTKTLQEAVMGERTRQLYPDSDERAFLQRLGLAAVPSPTLLTGVRGLAMATAQKNGGSLPGWMAMPAGLVVDKTPAQATEEAKAVAQKLPYIRYMALCRALGYLPGTTEASKAVPPKTTSLGYGHSVSPLAVLEKGLEREALADVPTAAGVLSVLRAARGATAHTAGSWPWGRRMVVESSARWVWADGRAKEEDARSKAMQAAELANGLEAYVMSLATIRSMLLGMCVEVQQAASSRGDGSSSPAGSAAFPMAAIVQRHRAQFAAVLGMVRHAELVAHPLYSDAQEVTRDILVHQDGAPAHDRAGPATRPPPHPAVPTAPAAPGVSPAAAAPAAPPAGTSSEPGVGTAPPPAPPPAVPSTTIQVSIAIMVPGPLLQQYLAMMTQPMAAAGLTITGQGGQLVVTLSHPVPGQSHSAQIIEALANLQLPGADGMVGGGNGGQPPFQMLTNLIAEAALSFNEDSIANAAQGGGAGLGAGGGGSGDGEVAGAGGQGQGVSLVADMDPTGANLLAMVTGNTMAVDDGDDDDEEEDDEDMDEEEEEDGMDEDDYEYGEEDEDGFQDAQDEDDDMPALDAASSDEEGDSDADDDGQPPPLIPVGTVPAAAAPAAQALSDSASDDDDPPPLVTIGGAGYTPGTGTASAGGAGGAAPAPSSTTTTGPTPAASPQNSASAAAASFFSQSASGNGGGNASPGAGILGMITGALGSLLSGGGGAGGSGTGTGAGTGGGGTGLAGPSATDLAALAQIFGPQVAAGVLAGGAGGGTAFPFGAFAAGLVVAGMGGPGGGMSSDHDENIATTDGSAEAMEAMLSGIAGSLPPFASSFAQAFSGAVSRSSGADASSAPPAAGTASSAPRYHALGAPLLQTLEETQAKGFSLFEPLVHHPVRAALASLLTEGQHAALPVLPQGLALDMLAHPDCDRRAEPALHALPLPLAVFLQTSGSAAVYGNATPALAHIHKARTEQVLPKGPMNKSHSLLDAATVRAMVAQPWLALSLEDTDPFSLLLALVSCAPSPAHVLHMACLLYTHVLSVSAASEGASKQGQVHRYVRLASLLLSLIAVPTPSAVPSAATVDDARGVLGPLVPLFLDYIDSLGTILSGVALTLPPEEGGAGGMDVSSATSLQTYVSAILPPDVVRMFLGRGAVGGCGMEYDDDTGAVGRGLAKTLRVLDKCGLLAHEKGHAWTVFLGQGDASGPLSAATALMPLLSPPSPPSGAQAHRPRLRLSLIPLPTHYDALYGSIRNGICRACEKRPRSPALCLVCGMLLCAGEECCRKASVVNTRAGRGAGELTRHARTCGGGTCCFLLLGIREASQVVLVRGRHAAYYGSPYTDSHGETDVGLARGRLLQLSSRRYAALAELWARGGIAREVARIRLNADRYIVDGHY